MVTAKNNKKSPDILELSHQTFSQILPDMSFVWWLFQPLNISDSYILTNHLFITNIHTPVNILAEFEPPEIRIFKKQGRNKPTSEKKYRDNLENSQNRRLERISLLTIHTFKPIWMSEILGAPSCL